MKIKIKWMKLNKKNRKNLWSFLVYAFILFAFIPSIPIVMKPFTSFKKRVTVKKIRRRFRRNSYFFTRTSFTDENNKRYHYEDSFIFGSVDFSLKEKELEKIKKGNSIVIKGYTLYPFGIPIRNVYDVE